MRPLPTYTLSELEARSGFDKRTIAYYISRRLLPKVGRRGPKTTYPPVFLDRLLFIRAVRNLQDEGRMSPVTLDEIRDVMEGLSDVAIRRMIGRKNFEEKIRQCFEERAGAMPAHAIAPDDAFGPWPGDEDDVFSSRTPPRAPVRDKLLARTTRRKPTLGRGFERAEAAADDEDVAEQLRAVLRQVASSADATAKAHEKPATETLTRVPITDDVMITVRNLDTKNAGLVERLASLLRRVGGLKNE